MEMRACSFAIAIVLLGGIAHADEPNPADRESARVAFAEGNKLRDDGNVRGALEKYKAAYALAPTPITALEVGRAEMDLGQLIEARDVLLHVASIPEARVESAKAQAARHEASALSSRLGRRIPKITIRVVGAVDQTSVSVDGVPVPREALAASRAVNPGRHAVLAMAFGHSTQQSVDLREGEARDVVLDVTTFAPKGVVSVTLPQTTIPTNMQVGGPSGLVAFNTPDDGHAWSLRIQAVTRRASSRARRRSASQRGGSSRATTASASSFRRGSPRCRGRARRSRPRAREETQCLAGLWSASVAPPRSRASSSCRRPQAARVMQVSSRSSCCSLVVAPSQRSARTSLRSVTDRSWFAPTWASRCASRTAARSFV